MLTLTEAAEQIRDPANCLPVELTRECLDRIERLNPVAQRLHHQSPPIRRWTRPAAPKPKSRPATIAGRCTASPSGSKTSSTPPGVRTTAASNQYRDRIPTEDAEVVRRLKQGGRRHPRQTQHARVRLRHERRGQRLRSRRKIPGTRSASPADRRRARPRPSPRACASPPWERTPPARSAAPARCAALWDIARAQA